MEQIYRNMSAVSQSDILTPVITQDDGKSKQIILCPSRRHGLRVFQNRVLWKIFGHKTDELTGKWRRLHNG